MSAGFGVGAATPISRRARASAPRFPAAARHSGRVSWARSFRCRGPLPRDERRRSTGRASRSGRHPASPVRSRERPCREPVERRHRRRGWLGASAKAEPLTSITPTANPPSRDRMVFMPSKRADAQPVPASAVKFVERIGRGTIGNRATPRPAAGFPPRIRTATAPPRRPAASWSSAERRCANTERGARPRESLSAAQFRERGEQFAAHDLGIGDINARRDLEARQFRSVSPNRSG